jgi:hypothetical protein
MSDSVPPTPPDPGSLPEMEESLPDAPSAPAVPQPPAPSVPLPPAPLVASPESRHAALSQAVNYQLSKGWQIDTQSEFDAVLSLRVRPAHKFHLIVTILTAGAWLVVWICVALFRVIFKKFQRVRVVVDPFGGTYVTAVTARK